MAGIVVAFSKQEDAISLKNILIRNGYEVTAVCTSGDMVLSVIDGYIDGIVVCGYKIGDMVYPQLREKLPKEFEMLVVASPAKLEGAQYEGVVGISMPLKIYDLVSTMDVMMSSLARKRKKRRSSPRERSPEEQKLINEAKEILMVRNNMSEQEAHRYMQKVSMDSGTNMVEAAGMILNLY